MKKLLLLWMFVALLALTACYREAPVNDPVGIAMIVKNGQIDYFRQIETSFRSICEEKDLEAYYYSTSSETAYQEQLVAVSELGKLGESALKGIIFVPSYGPNGENAEAEVAALASERGIPVIILDSPVNANGPLASAPYIGTDNTAAGKEMAQKVKADKVAVFAMINSPGIERATAFQALKPDAEVFRVDDTCNEEVLAVMDRYDDFVFFNGNNLIGSLAMLMAAGKHVYTFDVYGEFLDVLIAGSPSVRGVMAQNTFAMARKAVETIMEANGKQGEMVPTFYITTSNLDADEVQPFLEFYGRQVTPLNVAEKIMGKWVMADKDGQDIPTNEKMVFTFVSPTKAYVSCSFDQRKATWMDHVEADVKINGNKVTLTFHPNENNTSVHELTVTAINGNRFSAVQKVNVTVDGTVIISDEFACRFTKVNADYSEAILGLWECQGISGGETYNDANGRLEFLSDGTYRFYRMNDNGYWEMVTSREYQDYFVDGALMATRWKDKEEEEQREWWEITTLASEDMIWTALRQEENGATFHQAVKWKRIDLNIAENIIGKWVISEIDGKPAVTNDKTVLTFLSTTQATVSESKSDYSGPAVKWSSAREYEAQIYGNKVTLTGHPTDINTIINEYFVTSITADEMVCAYKHTVIRNDQIIKFTEMQLRFTKVTVDYSADIVGIWEGRCTIEGSEFDDGQVHRWGYKADGNYVYYVKDGDNWVPGDNTLNEYFVDGTLLCTRWVDDGEEYREWWEITIAGDKMNWTALRQDLGGDPYTVTFEMKKVTGAIPE
jgi:ABC-type sugar transport system substrate-binding protein